MRKRLSRVQRKLRQSSECRQSSGYPFREYKIILKESNFNFLKSEYPSHYHSNTNKKQKKGGRFRRLQKNPFHLLSVLNRSKKRED